MDEMIPAQKRSAILRYLQYGCLLAVVLAELVFLSPMGQRSGLALVTVDYFLAIPAMAFLISKGKGWHPWCWVWECWFGFALPRAFGLILRERSLNPAE